MYADTQLANLMKRRAGVGLDLSELRPKDAPVKNASGTTTGVGTFMERYSNTTREVGQSGRRGANMQTLSIHHPEVETFLHIKKDLTKVTGANISVKITDEFMKAVIENKDYEQRWPVDSKTPVISRMVNAKKIWDQIIENAWSTAEPGVIFWDTVLKWTTPQAYATKGFEHISTNPCSELVLSANDSCRLLLINALSYVKDPFTNKATFDYDLFAKHAQIGQRFMDDIVDLELECIDKILNKIKSDPESEQIKKIEMDLWKDIRKNCEDGRRTGLGLTAIGDTLAALGLTYGSEASIEATEKIYKTLAIESYRSSVIMAKDRGVFPVYEYELEKDHPFINRIMNEDQELKELWIKHGRRNIGNLTTAPAGSVSILTQTSSGIEPVFLTHYKRRKKINPNDKNSRVDFVDQLGDKWQEFMVYHHGFKNWMEINNKTEENFNESPYFGATSNDVNWKQSVKLQAAAQKWIDHSISKTCNLPESATKELVSEVYMEAYKLGCKGFTIYRDGSRSGVLVSDTSKKEQKPSNSIPENHAPKRPQELPCDIHVMTVKGEKWTFFVGKLNNKPYEILGGLSKYVNIPKRIKEGKIVKHNGPNNPVARYDLHYDFEKGPEDETVLKDLVNIFENATEAAFTRTLSLSLRHGVPIQYIVEQVSKGSESDDDLFSFSKAVSRVLKTYIVDGTKASSSKKCPSCKEEGGLIYSEGCIGCKYCSYSKCS
jgi:ribonucleoside-diphosphate reductase alpha chain